MSKGIIIGNPSPTSGKVTVALADDNSFGVGQSKWLNYKDTRTDPDKDLKVNDTVEFIITSESDCEITNRFVASQGIVTPEDKWKVKITTESNDFKVKKGDELIYDFYPNEQQEYPGPDQMPVVKIGDTIEVIVTSVQSSVFVQVIQSAK